MNDIVKRKSDELKNVISQYSNNQIKENTDNAVTYLLANMDGLKYLLSAYNIKDRQRIMLNHLNQHFGKIDNHVITKILNKERIYSVKLMKFLTYILPFIILVITFISFNLYMISAGWFIFSLLVGTFLYLLIGVYLESRNKTSALTYRLSKEYKHLYKPNQKL